MENQHESHQYTHPSRMAIIEEESMQQFPSTNSAFGRRDEGNDEVQGSITKMKDLESCNATSLAPSSTRQQSIKMPRRHGKRRYGPGGQYTQLSTATKNVPKISKTKRRRREKVDNRIWRDHTPMPKRAKDNISNEERSLATKARKAENKKAREDQEARKKRVMQELRSMMEQTKDSQVAANGGQGMVHTKGFEDKRA